MLSIQPVVVLGNGLVLKLRSICVEVSAFVLPAQISLAALKRVHGEMAGNVYAFGACISAHAWELFSSMLDAQCSMLSAQANLVKSCGQKMQLFDASEL